MIKTTVKEKYEKYIGTLRETISKFQSEWDTLYESYQNLLGDIKKLMINNEKLKVLVLELEGKIDNHNKQVISNDTNIKQQIELLTKHSLSKKTIDWLSQKEVMVKTSGEMEALNAKVKRMEMKEYNSSSMLSSVAADMDNFSKENRSVAVTSSTIITKGIVDHGYGSVEYNTIEDVVESVAPRMITSNSETKSTNNGTTVTKTSTTTTKNAGTNSTNNGTTITKTSTTSSRTNNGVVFTTTTSTKGDTITKTIKK